MKKRSVPSSPILPAWLRSLLIASFIAATLISSTAGKSGVGPVVKQTTQEGNKSSTPTQSVAVDSKGEGTFKIRYEQRKSLRRTKAGCKIGTDWKGIQSVVDSLNESVSLPFDVYFVFKDCGESEVYYDDQTRQIAVCYEWMDLCGSLFAQRIKSKSQCSADAKGAFAFGLFHEAAHAIVDTWKLPVTGKEEDVADQFASLLLIEKMEHGGNLAISAALGFKFYANLERFQKKIYWDEHSLDEQRFYEIICMVYGHDPEKYSYLTRNGTLPWERAALCTEDYPRIRNAWQTLLAPHVKSPPGPVQKAQP